MNRLIFTLLFILPISSATLYLNNGSVKNGYFDMPEQLTEIEYLRVRFINNETDSLISVQKSYIDSVQIKGKTLRYVKGALLEHLPDTSDTIFNVGKGGLKKGIYRNYAEFYYNSPGVQVGWALRNPHLRLSSEKRKEVKTHNAYIFFDTLSQKEVKIRSEYYGYCDGENVYLISGSHLCRILIGENFIYSLALEKVSVERGNTVGSLNPTIAPVSQGMPFPPVGLNIGLNILTGNVSIGIGMGSGPTKVRRWGYKPLIIEKNTGVIHEVLNFRPHNIEEVLSKQPTLLKEYNAIAPSVIKANPLLKTEFLFRYLDLIDSPCFSWFDKRLRIHKKDLEQYKKKK